MPLLEQASVTFMAGQPRRTVVGYLASWAVFVAAAITVVTERALPLALVIAVVALGLHWWALGRPYPVTALDGPLLILLALACFAFLHTADLAQTRLQVARLVVGIALFYAVVAWTRQPWQHHVVALGLTATGLGLALGALVMVHWETYKFTFIPASLYTYLQPRVQDGVNPNVMAGYLALLAPCVAAPLLFRPIMQPRLVRSFNGVVLVVMLIVLVLTQSRAGVLAAGCGLVTLVALRWNSRRMLAGYLGLAGLGLLGLFGLSSLFGMPGLQIVGGAERIEIYQHALRMLGDHWLIGVGIGSFPTVLNAAYPLQLTPQGVPHAHNLFLQIALDLGLPGLFVWSMALGLATLMAWRVFWSGRQTDQPWSWGLAAGLLASQVVLVIHGSLDAVTWGMVRPAVLVWALWGWMVALYLSVMHQP